jgi:hypothetical protein
MSCYFILEYKVCNIKDDEEQAEDSEPSELEQHLILEGVVTRNFDLHGNLHGLDDGVSPDDGIQHLLVDVPVFVTILDADDRITLLHLLDVDGVMILDRIHPVTIHIFGMHLWDCHILNLLAGIQ